MSAVATAKREPVAAFPYSATLLAEALADLRADFDELLFLVRSAEAELAATAADLDEARERLYPETFEMLAAQIRGARSRNGAIGRRLLALRQLASPDRRATPSRLAEIGAQKTASVDLLRTERTIVAALATAADWQSPSFLHSMLPAAGRQYGRIRPHWNDYKRDRNLDAEGYEHAYVVRMLDGPPDLRALLTSCGMAAFTTVLAFLRDERRLERPVVIGRGLYHETRELLERGFRGQVHAVDERETGAILRAIDELRPSAVFLDSLSNTRGMPVPDLRAVIKRLRGRETTLVIDNTGLSVSLQPFALAGDGVRLIVFESLLKYAQLGLDRANAGVIVARGEDAEGLADYREHLGTNVADVAVHALPRPERWVLERRLGRLQRNAALLAERLRARVDDLAEVVYPGLAEHPCYPVARALSFRGGCFSLVLSDEDGELSREQALVEAAVVQAERRGIPLIGGASFGFNTTRIYLTGARAERGDPFVRVSAGTEHRLEVEALAEVLAAAVREVVC